MQEHVSTFEASFRRSSLTLDRTQCYELPNSEVFINKLKMTFDKEDFRPQLGTTNQRSESMQKRLDLNKVASSHFDRKTDDRTAGKNGEDVCL